MKRRNRIVRAGGVLLTLVVLSLFAACGVLPVRNSLSAATVESGVDSRQLVEVYEEGVAQELLGNDAAAMDMLGYVVRQDSMHDAAHFRLGLMFMRLSDVQKSLYHMGMAYRYNPKNYWYGVGMLNLARALKLNDVAIQVAEAQIRNFPDKPEQYLELSELYSQSNRKDDALEALDRAERFLGKSEEVYESRFKIYMEKGDESLAFSMLDSLVRAGGDIRYRLVAGELCMEINQFDRALTYYKEALEVEPNNGYALLALANYYEIKSQDDLALKTVEQAIRYGELDLNTKIAILQKELVKLLSKKKSIEECQLLFEFLVEQHPQSEELFQLYAAYLVEIGKVKEGREKLEVVVNLSPTNKEAWVQLLQLELTEKEYRRVVDMCKRALVYHPDVSFFYLYSGIAYSLMKKDGEAIKMYEQGIVVFENSDAQATSELYGQIGDIYQSEGSRNKEKAKKAYESALKYNPKSVAVMNNYAYFLSVIGEDLERAESLSGKTVESAPNNPTYLDTYAWIYFKRGNYTLAKLYIESALQNGGEENAEVIEHYGDILYMNDEKEAALDQWKKVLGMGEASELLKKKIEQKKYIAK